MDKKQFKAELDLAGALMDKYTSGLAGMDPDLRDDVRKQRKQAIIKELIDEPANGLSAVRRRLRAGVQELQAERNRVGSPEIALLTAAWTGSATMPLTNAQRAILDNARMASPEVLEHLLGLAADHPAALVALGNVLRDRKQELEEAKALDGLSTAYQKASEAYVDKAEVRKFASLELRALRLEHKALEEIDNADPAQRLALGRKIDALERKVADEA